MSELTDLFDTMRSDMAFIERLLLTPDEPPTCDRCRHGMLCGFVPHVRPRICRECKQTLQEGV